MNESSRGNRIVLNGSRADSTGQATHPNGSLPASSHGPDQREEAAPRSREPIAVVGMGCRFPGDADSPDAYWNLLAGGVDAITKTPADRWNLDRFYRPGESVPGKTQSQWGGFVRGIDRFDASLFGISPREAAAMDPQQRMLLEVAYRAMEDAGQPAEQLAGTDVAVFAGISSFDYAVASLNFRDRGEIGPYSNTGGSSSIAANRISYCFDFRGPSVAVDTACSSSLVALHMACESLWRGEASAAIAGGVNALLLPDFYVAFSQLGVLSPDGRCKTFDATANGYARSEGAGAVLLRPLSEAIAHGDRIYCVIRATALNQDGRTPGLTVPSGEQQRALVQRACQLADVRPRDISYVEAHGTGTAVGDPIEARALAEIIGQDRTHACRIGSVKTNIGHLEAGAGMASLIKVALALHRRQIPPHLHLESPNPEIDFDSWGLRVPTELETWEPIDGQRIAGINGFGYGGANAHVVIAESPVQSEESNDSRVPTASPVVTLQSKGNATKGMPRLLPVSAANEAALVEVAQDWKQHLADHDFSASELDGLASFATYRRSHLESRAIAIGRDSGQWESSLAEIAEAAGAGTLPRRLPAEVRDQGIAFLCCGQGPQWWAMGRGLYRDSRVFRDTIDRIDQEFRKHTHEWQLVEELQRDAAHSQMSRTSIAQPALFAIQVAQAAMWDSIGIRPALLIGHSVGEIAAAHLSGGLDFADACCVAVHRGRTMDLATSRGAMIAAGITPSEAHQRIADIERVHPGSAELVSLAAVNGPASVTISGDCDVIEQLARNIESDDIFCRRLAVEYAFHSPQMDPVEDELLRSLAGITTRPLHTPLISTVSGRPVTAGDDLGADYWWQNVRQAVRFADAVMQSATRGIGIAVELGPHPVLTFATAECYGHANSEVTIVPSARRPKQEDAPEDDATIWCAGVRSLDALGVTISWEGLTSLCTRHIETPTYPMQRRALWAESHHANRCRLTPLGHPLLGDAELTGEPNFAARIDPKTHQALQEHRVRGAAMFPAAASIETALAAAKTVTDGKLAAAGDDPATQIRLHRFRLLNPMLLGDSDPQHLETSYRTDRDQIQIAFRQHHDEHRVTLAETYAGTPWQAIPNNRLQELAAKCDEDFTSEECYECCTGLGLDYGPLFRGVRGGKRVTGHALATISLPESSLDEANRYDAALYHIHPAVLDSCFHTMLVADIDFEYRRGFLYLPFEINELQFDLAGMAGAGVEWPLTVATSIVMKDAHRLIADLDLFDPAGNCVGRIRGFESRVVGSEESGSTADLMYRYQWQPSSTDDVSKRSFDRVLIFGDGPSSDADLAKQLSSEDAVFVTVGQATEEIASNHWVVDPDDEGSFHTLFESLCGDDSDNWQIFYLWGMQAVETDTLESAGSHRSAERIRESTLWTVRAPLNLAKAWQSLELSTPCHLAIVTRGAQSGDERDDAVAIAQMPLVGFGRVMVSEMMSPLTRLIDLDPNAGAWASTLAAEVSRDDAEDEVMLRGGERFVQRFVPDGPRELSQALIARGDHVPFRLAKGVSSGVRELIHESFTATELGPQEVEIEVAGAGLNFSDVMKALNLYPGLPPGPVPLGAECSGSITRIGSDVTDFVVGDAVIAIAPGAFASHVVVNAALVALAPRQMDLVDAAAIPVAYLTADHAINTCARMRAGESLLVHSASGGVGLAAIDIASDLGVEVLATAGSESKRDYVRALGVTHVFDSRSLEFVREIRELTEQSASSGIDGVLNSLPGEALRGSLSLLKIGGRFLEIGKRDIYADAALGLFPMRNNLAFFAIDLDQLFKEQALEMGQRLRFLVSQIDAGRYHPHTPTRFAVGGHIDLEGPEQDAADAASDCGAISAFRFMQQAKHVGKVVVDYTDRPTKVRSRDEVAFRFRESGTYWIAGGLGGFGLRIAQWMAESGAGTIVLSGRSKTVRPEAEKALEEMRAHGTRVEVVPCDITDPDSVEATLQQIDETCPPLCGVLHTAMVLEDKLIADLDRDTLDRVLWPKVVGGWNLHRATRERKLEQFILFSSLSSVFGHAGQANYSAANAMLDGLAHHRRVMGLPATVINWGHLGEVGYLAEREDLSERLRRQGVLDFSATEATECLARALHRHVTQCSVLRMDWSKWRGLGLTRDVSPRFAHLIRGGSSSGETSLNAQSLREAAPEQRSELLRAAIGEKLAALLGTDAGTLDASRPMLELGLDSLMAVELRNWIEGTLQLKLQIGALMRGSSLDTLVQTLCESTGSATGDGSGSQPTVPTVMAPDPAMQDRGRYPMSEQQTGLWYAFRRDSDGTTFNVNLPVRMRSKLDVDRLRNAMYELVRRNSALRTTFTDKAGSLEQIVHDDLPPEFSIVQFDLGTPDEDGLLQHVIEETQRPFDLENGPLMRIRLFQLAEDDWIVVTTTHHIVVDFWSLILILGQLREIYPALLDGSSPSIPAPRHEYFDFVATQRAILASEEGRQLSDYWRKTLEGIPTVLEVPTDRIRPANFTARASVMGIEFPDTVGAAVNQVAQRCHATNSSVVLAALQVMLSRYTGREKFVIGSPFAGRLRSDLEETVGFFVNMLPLVADLSPAENANESPTFEQIVHRAGDRLVDSMQHEAYPYSRIVRDLVPPRDTSRTALIQVSCTFERAQDREEEGRAGFLFPRQGEVSDFNGIEQENYYVPHQTCHYDLEFIFEQVGDELRGMIVYCEDLFEADSMQLMANNFAGLLESLVNQVELPIESVPWTEAFAPRDKSTAATGSSGVATVPEMLAKAAQDNPDALATIHPECSHKHLSALTDRVAHYLIDLGVEPGDLIPVVADRGLRSIAMIVGVQRTGATPIPIDSRSPSVDAGLVLSQTQCQRLLTDSPNDWTRVALQLDSNLRVITWNEVSDACEAGTQNDSESKLPVVDPDSPAYVIYTSGTTGTPKGVVVSHRAITNTLTWRHRITPLRDGDRILMTLSHQFDAGLGMMLIGLTQGATIVWPEQDVANIDATIQQLLEDQITVLIGVPAWVDLVSGHEGFEHCQQLTYVWMGGEAMPEGLPRKIRRQTDAQIWNFYGPTEAAVECSAYRIDDVHDRRPIPVGYVTDNMQAYILDERLREVPDTVCGQLAVAGPGLADGYLGRQDLTDKVFVTLENGTRAYLTGDIARRRPDGAIDLFGRSDRQIKWQGYRLEPAEIETCLMDVPHVNDAVVCIRPAENGNQFLAAFVTSSNRAVVDAASSEKPPQSLRELELAIRHHLNDRLPPYKRPSRIIWLDAIPRNANGKVDFNALPQEISMPDTADMGTAPSTPLEKHLAELWSDRLGISPIGVGQSFFELGGSSLQAAMLTNDLSEDLRVDVPTALLFDLSDISGMARRLVQLYPAQMTERFGEESLRIYDGELAAAGSRDDVTSLIAPLKANGSQRPVFMIHPPGGIVVCYRELAAALPEQRPLYAIRSRGLHGREALPSSLPAMAEEYVRAIRTVQERGPYVVGGWSIGGIIAFEVAHQLIRLGESIEQLILLDTAIPQGASDLVAAEDQQNAGLEYGIDLSLDELIQLKPDQQLPFLWEHARKMGLLDQSANPEVAARAIEDLRMLFHHHMELTRKHRLEPIDCPVLFVRPNEVPVESQGSEDRGWSKLAVSVHVSKIPGHHHSMVQSPNVESLAEKIAASLRSSPQRSASSANA